jgi:hypothetical protein
VLDRQKLKFPLTSLVLLFITYTTFGWLLHDWTNNRQVWLLVGLGTIVLAGIATFPSRSVSIGFGGFFKTDTRALILIVLGSMLSVVFLTWLQVFVDAVILSAAGFLVSLDLKTRGWNDRISLLVIIGWQLLGMSAGLGLHYLYQHPITDLPVFLYTDYWFKILDRVFK